MIKRRATIRASAGLYSLDRTTVLSWLTQCTGTHRCTAHSAGTPTRRKTTPDDSEEGGPRSPAPPKPEAHWHSAKGHWQSHNASPANQTRQHDPPIYSPPRAGQARPQPGAQPPSFSNRSATLATGNIPPLSPTVMRRNIVDRQSLDWNFWSLFL